MQLEFVSSWVFMVSSWCALSDVLFGYSFQVLCLNWFWFYSSIVFFSYSLRSLMEFESFSVRLFSFHFINKKFCFLLKQKITIWRNNISHLLGGCELTMKAKILWINIVSSNLGLKELFRFLNSKDIFWMKDFT